MDYQVSASASARGEASFSVRNDTVAFGVAADEQQLPNPAELLLGSFAACCLKNVERFSRRLKFTYESARIEVVGERQDAPPKMTAIRYVIQI